MAREQLQALTADLNRLLLAGAAAAAGDERLRQHVRTLQALGAQVPAFARLAEAVGRIDGAAPERAGPPFLEVLLAVRQVSAQVAAPDAAGTAAPGQLAGPWHTPTAGQEVYAFREWLGSDARLEALRSAASREKLADLRLLDPLLGGLSVPNKRWQAFAADEALPGFGRALVDELQRDLVAQPAAVAGSRLRVLSRIDRRVATDVCRSLLGGRNAALRAEALPAFADLEPREAAKRALQLLPKARDSGFRAAVLAALKGARTKAALDALLAAVSESAPVWAGALVALAKLPHPQTVPRLFRELESAATGLQSTPAGSSARKGRKRDQDPGRLDTVIRLVQALAARGDPQTDDTLVRLFATFPVKVRRRLAVALRAHCPDAAATGRIYVEALKDPDDLPGYDLACALHQIGQAFQHVVPALIELLHDASANARRNAATALRNIGPPAAAAVPAVLAAFQDPDERVRRWAMMALRAIRPEPGLVLQPLLGALHDKDMWVRAYTAEVLAELGPEARVALPVLRGLKENQKLPQEKVARAIKALEKYEKK
jgi:HEAT repeat protein